ncbi:MAG: flagella basal body P-ring formation protein FlgA [Thalassolituus oleivorans]
MRQLLLITSLLLAAAPAAWAQPLGGPGTSSVASMSPEDAILSAATRAVAGRIPGSAGSVEVSVVRVSDLPEGTTFGPSAVHVELPQSPVVPKGRLQISFSVGTERLGTALIQVAHFDSVAIAIEQFSSGDAIIPSSLHFVWMETTRFSGEPVTPGTLDRWGDAELMARRYLRTDSPLRTTDIGPRPAAETGEPVRMSYRRGAFLLDLSCRARERGQLGDIIRLYADDSDTVYRARLVGAGRAEWIETL